MKQTIIFLISLMPVISLWADPTLDIFISEVMYDPPISGTMDGFDYSQCTNGQCAYVEITNCTGAAVNISNFQFTDGNGSSVDLFIPNGTSIGPMETVVLARNRTTFINAFGDPGVPVIGGLPHLNPNGETPLTLSNSSGVACTVVIYNGTEADRTGESIYFDKNGNKLGTGTPTPGQNLPLPVELLYFHAQPDEGQISLSWATVSEINNDYFTVETSLNGKIFEEIGRLAGAGNTVEEQRYTYQHQNPAEGNNYYRLKQTDFDGTFSYSDVLVIAVQKSGGLTIRPTAVKDQLTITLQEAYQRDTKIQVFDLRGASVYEGIWPAGAVNGTVDIAHLKSGHYFLRLDASQRTKAIRFVKL